MEITLENVKETIEKYGAQGQHPEEVLDVLQFLSQDPPKIIVEIGVWHGGNAAILKTFFPEAKYIGVDYCENDDPKVSTPPSRQSNIDKFGLNMVIGNSWDKKTVEKVLELVGEGNKIDYLFIDGSHDYDSVKWDFEAYNPYAKITGFHDTYNDIGVKIFWKEIIQKRNHKLFIHDGGLGIGIIL